MAWTNALLTMSVGRRNSILSLEVVIGALLHVPAASSDSSNSQAVMVAARTSGHLSTNLIGPHLVNS